MKTEVCDVAAALECRRRRRTVGTPSHAHSTPQSRLTFTTHTLFTCTHCARHIHIHNPATHHHRPLIKHPEKTFLCPADSQPLEPTLFFKIAGPIKHHVHPKLLQLLCWRGGQGEVAAEHTSGVRTTRGLVLRCRTGVTVSVRTHMCLGVLHAACSALHAGLKRQRRQWAGDTL